MLHVKETEIKFCMWLPALKACTHARGLCRWGLSCAYFCWPPPATTSDTANACSCTNAETHKKSVYFHVAYVCVRV